jgi:TPR repeat protein/serine/threonine protein kinase
MTTDEKTADSHLIRIEKHYGDEGSERWCKLLSPDFPAAAYWLCHEAQILQEFHNSHPAVAKFVSLDLDRLALVMEAPGHLLSQLLSVPAEGLQHPFQRSSDLIRLLNAVCQAVASIHAKGVVHGGLRLDNILLGLTDEGRVDFESVKLIDFANSHSHRHPLEKPPFLDSRQSPDKSGLSEAYLKALAKDWEHYARICGEEGRGSWDELSDKAKRRYGETLIPSLQVNQNDWRADLYALGYWFRQLSLWRIDYYSDDHQERIPKLLKKMQKPVWQGGFKSMEAVLRELETFELDANPPIVSANPEFAPLEDLTPLPKSGAPASNGSDNEFALAKKPAAASGAMPSLGGSRPATGASQPTGSEGGKRKKTAEKNEPLAMPRVNWKAAAIAAVAVIWVAAWFAVSGNKKENAAAEKAPEAKVILPPSPSDQPAAKPAAPAAPALPPPAVEKPVEAEADAGAGGEIPPANAKEAFGYYLKRANSGDAAAQAKIGQMYREGRGTGQNFADAVKWYRKAAEQGNAEGQARLGFMYMTGLGVKKDEAEALKWHRKAAEQGSAIGQYNLGLMYLNGRGVTANTIQAYMWLKLASAQDSAAREKLRALVPRMSNVDVLEAERLADEWRHKHSGMDVR